MAFGLVKQPVVVLAVLLTAHLGVGHAQGPPAQSDAPHNWYSEHKNPEAIGYDIVTLFALLYLRDALPLDSYQDRTGKSVVEIMREQKRFVGPAFPAALDLLLCVLNPDVCKIASVGGASKATWSGKAGTTYMLPAITFETYRTAERYEKKKDEQVEDIVPRKTWGCEHFDQACRDFIAHLNPSLKNPFDPGYAGVIVLPGFGVKARVPGLDAFQAASEAPSPQQRAASDPSDRAKREAEEARLRKIREEEAIHKIQRSGKIPDFGTSYRAVQKNIPAKGQYRIESKYVSDFHYKDYQLDLFRVLGHPLHDGPLSPTTYANPVAVAILDTWVDETHCEFKGPPPAPKFNNKKPRPAPPGATGPPPVNTTCADPVADGVPGDHGTHVAALIGAKANGIGIVGINPLSQIITYEADASDPASMASLVDAAVGQYSRIVNVSLSTGAQGNDPVLRRIRNLEESVLFVVAAGNQGEDMNDQCPRYPACYHLRPNVITVVALDNNYQVPSLWSEGPGRGSNHAQGFHLGVPAISVVSGTVGGRYGRLTGTSQAAPVVAGAASLLYMRNASLAPVMVKERLIYTADLFPTLLPWLLGGRLNIGRALKIDHDLIEKRNGELITGRIRKQNARLVLKTFDDEEGLPVPLAMVKRLVRLSDGEYPFTVFTVKVQGGGRKLDRLSDVSLPADLRLMVEVTRRDRTKSITQVRLDEIKDFTSALKDQP